MKKKISLAILGMIMIFSMFSLISAVPPVQTNTIIDKGITIESPLPITIKTGQDYTFHIHAYNATDGVILFDPDIHCIIHIYNKIGNHVIEANMTPDSNGVDFQYLVLGENFTESGHQSVLYDCQNTNIGGFLQIHFDITPSGELFEISQAILYGFILVLLGLFLFFSISGIKNAISEKADVLL